MKAPTKNEQTSFHGHEVKATPNELIAIATALEAQFSDCNTGEDKTNFDFDFQTDGGTYFTVYDWKEYRAVGMNETVSWHIGGGTPMSSSEGQQELSNALAKLRTTPGTMSNEKNTGGPAFPTAMEDHRDGILHYDQPGMTMRDYFAAKAMQGMLSSEAMIAGSVRAVDQGVSNNFESHAAQCAYELADAMLKAREQ